MRSVPTVVPLPVAGLSAAARSCKNSVAAGRRAAAVVAVTVTVAVGPFGLVVIVALPRYNNTILGFTFHAWWVGGWAPCA